MTDKTEAPTPHRLQEAREEGQVVRSQELITAVVILSGAFLLRGPGKQLALDFGSLLTETITKLPTAELTVESLRGLFFTFGSGILPPLAFIMFGLLFA